MNLLLLCALCAPTTVLRSQDPTTTALSDKIKLVHLLDLSAEQLGVNIAYDDKLLTGEVTLRLGRGIENEELWAFTNRVLAARGFTTVEMAGEAVLTVVRLQEAFGLAQLERGDATQARAGYVRVLRPLQFKTSADIVPAVQRLLSNSWGKALDVGQGNTVLIGDLKPVVEQVLWLIDQLDRPDPRVVEDIPVDHRRASDLVTQLDQISEAWAGLQNAPLRGKVIASADERGLVLVAPESEAQQWRQWITQFDRSEPVVTRTYVPRFFDVREVADLLEELTALPEGRASTGDYRQVVNELVGTIIVTATLGVHEEIQQLFSQLDASGGRSVRSVRSFPVRNRSVIEILEVLDRLVQAGALDAGIVAPVATEDDSSGTPATQSSQNFQDPGGQAFTAVSDQDPKTIPPLALTADEGTNTLIAIGEVRLLNEVEELLLTLDVRQPQIMVEALVLALSETQSLDLGVELRARLGKGDTLVALSSLFGLGAPDLGDSTIRNQGVSGLSGLVLNPGDFSAVVRALEAVNHGRALSIPKVLVNNNQDATLDSVLQSPYLSTNASNTVATTSFGGTQDAGTQITVTPHLTAGDNMLLSYRITASTFVGEALDPSLPPPRQQNTLSSVVSVPDGYTVVLGGLDVQTEGEATRRVPFLGSIPLIGALFRSRSTSVERQRFFVFLRATVLRRADFEDLKYWSDRDREEAGLADQWPVVKPKMVR